MKKNPVHNDTNCKKKMWFKKVYCAVPAQYQALQLL